MNRLVTLSAAVLLQIFVIQTHAEVDDQTYVGYGSGFTISGVGTKVSSASSLQSAARTGRKKITVSGSIKNALVICGNDLHIKGDGSAVLEEVSFLIKGVSNVTIQNLTMHLPYGKTIKGSDHDGDVIHIEESKNIWIDHCDLSNRFDGVGKDTYDGLIDAKKGASNITISWNYIHDSHKMSLIGHSDKDESGEWNLSMHHNIFNKIGSRIPSMRAGEGAVFNNYYLIIKYTCINSRIGAEIYCEKNYFDSAGTGKVEKPLKLGEGPIGAWYSSKPGKYNAVDNYYIRCKGNQPTNIQSTTKYKPSFMNGNSTVIPVMDVPKVLMEKAGVPGKKKTLVYPDGYTRTIQATKSVFKTQMATSSAMYNTLGMRVSNTKTSPKVLANSVYITRENGRSVVRLNTAR